MHSHENSNLYLDFAWGLPGFFGSNVGVPSEIKSQMVEDLHTEGVTVKLLCDTVEVSKSGYYAWTKRPESERAKSNMLLTARIRSIHEKSNRTYGSPRVAAQLRSEGLQCGKNRVARLMRGNEIVSESVKKFKITTTDSNHDLPVAERIFETENVEAVMAPNQVWGGDITYIATEEGWLFLAIFLDLFTRKVVGFSCDDNMWRIWYKKDR